MIEPSRPQISFAEGLIEEEVGALWEPWMRQVDELLADRELLQIVYQALARRSPKSRTRGRPGTPAEVVLRLLLLKHIRNQRPGCRGGIGFCGAPSNFLDHVNAGSGVPAKPAEIREVVAEHPVPGERPRLEHAGQTRGEKADRAPNREK